MTSSRTALILAAHGSSINHRINEPVFQLADQISRSCGNMSVTPAFLDGKPDIRSIIHQIEEDKVIVVPLMTSQGYYTSTLFPELLTCPGKTVQFADAIGLYPALRKLVADRLSFLLGGTDDPCEVTVVIVGHGTRKNKSSCRSTIDLVQRLRNFNVDLKIDFAFIDQNPGIEQVASRISTPQMLLIPFLIGSGPHTTRDVPKAFGLKHFEHCVFETGFQFPYVEVVETKSGGQRKIVYDAPIGSYEQLASVCVSIVREVIHRNDKRLPNPACLKETVS